VLRAFAIARNDSYVVMPGGLTRVAPDRGASRISNQAGAITKDTWVLASEPEPLTGFWLQSGPAVEGIDPMSSMPSRAAEGLWWLGRYAERAEALTRLLRTVHDRRRYIVTAYGRDYSDVPPMNGGIYTEGETESLRAIVDVVAMSAAGDQRDA
jgi:hypothetical protein